MRRKLPWSERKRRVALEATFETIKSLAVKHEGGARKGLSTLYNIALYLLLADRDIQASKLDALTHPDEWTRNLNARLILLTIYEWDADKVTGRQLRHAFDLLLTPEELRREANEALGELRATRKKATNKFSFVRNAAIAHRDANALVQYRAIRDLRVDDVMAIAIDFFAAAQKFVGALTKIMIAASSSPSILILEELPSNSRQRH